MGQYKHNKSGTRYTIRYISSRTKLVSLSKMAFRPMHLQNAPIVEAMIAFDFATNTPNQAGALESFYRQIESDYPIRTPVQEAKVTFNADGSAGSTETIGARFASADGKQVCVIFKHSFVCSRLQPYETWESLRMEFQRLWSLYTAQNSVSVTKAAVRYINKLFIPLGAEVQHYLNTYPAIPAQLPQTFSNVVVRLEVAIPEPKGILIVTEAQLPSDKEGYVAIVLDHDLQFLRSDETWNEWDILERARELKNDYFFASISEKLLKEYK